MFGAGRDLLFKSLFTVLYQDIHVWCCESHQDCDVSKQTMTRNEIAMLVPGALNSGKMSVVKQSRDC